MENCPFCDIARSAAPVGLVCQTPRLVAFVDHRPIRPGHLQIIPRDHYVTFDELPEDLAAEIVVLGQKIARVQKAIYGVDRVGFVFTGNDVPHCHAHVLPLHSKNDITSAQYLADQNATFRPPALWSKQAQTAEAKRLRRAFETP